MTTGDDRDDSEETAAGVGSTAPSIDVEAASSSPSDGGAGASSVGADLNVVTTPPAAVAVAGIQVYDPW